ncbi:hypothetical protein ACFFMN_23065 [Planobispora siamensis]|uniref:Uncharacterized protein n=1 Tax=Planobispora siamensis TaxID=936338 RepID=A0A8J3WLM1_9ACTN|nr:hypothetical protein [Planobispora siamensis]GIH95449.1 hypothetical protein Psi01_60790 [Planobispora siamensis]
MARGQRRIIPVTPQPSRHPGSRVVTTTPDVVRAVTDIRQQVGAQAARVRREDVTFTSADPARGEPCTAAAMTNTLVTTVYRSGHTLYVDLAMGTGAASVMEARITVPDLSITGAAIDTPAGGVERDIRVQLSLPDAWPMGEAHRVYIQARRVSGGDATTVRVLRAWQR